MSSVARQQRQEVMDFIRGIALFEDLTLVSEDTGDFQNEYERSLGPEQVNEAGKQGVMAVFHSVLAPPDKEDDFGRVWKFIHSISVLENVEVNRNGTSGTGVTREEWVERLARNITGIFKPTVAASELIIAPPGIDDDTTRIRRSRKEDDFVDYPTRFLTLACTGGLAAPDMPVLAKPVLTPAAGGTLDFTITMASATPGAAIFYTLNGDRPRPGSTLYTGPLDVASGTTIKARAYLSGYLQPGSRDRDSITTLTV